MTNRQREILILIAQDNNTKTIAGIFGLSIKTVEHHWAAIKRKTKIKTPVSAVYYCLDQGLIELKKSNKVLTR